MAVSSYPLPLLTLLSLSPVFDLQNKAGLNIHLNVNIILISRP